jgi:hypothetical protein
VAEEEGVGFGGWTVSERERMERSERVNEGGSPFKGVRERMERGRWPVQVSERENGTGRWPAPSDAVGGAERAISLCAW